MKTVKNTFLIALLPLVLLSMPADAFPLESQSLGVAFDAPGAELALRVLVGQGSTAEDLTATLSSLRTAAAAAPNQRLTLALLCADSAAEHVARTVAVPSAWAFGALTIATVDAPDWLALWLSVESVGPRLLFIVEAGIRVHPRALAWSQLMGAAYRERHHVGGLQPAALPREAAASTAWLPHTQPFLHPLVLPGVFVAMPGAWQEFVRWMPAAPTSAAVAGALPVAITAHLQPHPHPHRTAANEPAARRWDAWYMAYAVDRHLLTLFPPLSEVPGCSMSVSAVGRTASLPQANAASTGSSADSCTAWVAAQERTPARLMHLDWDAATVAYCRRDSCPGETCVNSAEGFVCCPGDTLCAARRPEPSAVLRLVAQCGEPAGRLIHTLNHIEEANLHPPEARAADVSPGVELHLVIFGAIDGHQRAMDPACHSLLEVAERWPWPRGHKRIALESSPLASTSNTKTRNAQAVIDAVWPAALAQRDEHAAPMATVLLQAGVELSPLFYRWLVAASAAYGTDARLAGAALVPDWHGEAEQRATGDLVGIAAAAHVDVGRGALAPFAARRPSLVAWAERNLAATDTDWIGELWPGEEDEDATAQAKLRESVWHTFLQMFRRFCQSQVLFTLQPQGRAMARLVEDTDTVALATQWNGAVFSPHLQAIDLDKQPIALCGPGTCPVHSTCRDTYEGAVCMCEGEGARCFGGADVAAGGVEHAVRLLDDTSAVHRMLLGNSRDNAVVVLTVSGGFVDFFRNWALSARRVGVTNYIVIAEDYDAYKQVEAFAPGQVVLSSVRLLFRAHVSILEVWQA